jgi:hypothetical protein
MAQRLKNLTLRLDAGDDVDSAGVDELTRQLRRELLQLDVESVDLARAGPPPSGTRAVDVAAVGTLVVTLFQSTGLLGAVVGAVQSWLSASGRRSVRLELDGDVIEVGGLSSVDQRRLIATWIARHGAVASP